MSRTFLWGVSGAVFVIAVFLAGFFVGANVEKGFSDLVVSNMQASQEKESSQMQCIHWVDKWKSIGPSPNPVFGMYTALCGRPDVSRQQ